MRIRAKQLVVAATAAVALLAVSLPASADVTGRAVQIGVMYPLTGQGATWGKHVQIGIRLVVEAVNSPGGICGVSIKLVEYEQVIKSVYPDKSNRIVKRDFRGSVSKQILPLTINFCSPGQRAWFDLVLATFLHV